MGVKYAGEIIRNYFEGRVGDFSGTMNKSQQLAPLKCAQFRLPKLKIQIQACQIKYAFVQYCCDQKSYYYPITI